MTWPLDAGAGALPGTEPQWFLLAVTLPLVGRAVADAWREVGVLAAQRALLIVLVYLALALLVAWPIHTVPLVLGTLPLFGASLGRTRPTLTGTPVSWVGAALVAAPAISASLVGPYLWVPFWFLGIVLVAMVRGAFEPLVDLVGRLRMRLRTIRPAAARSRGAPARLEDPPPPHPPGGRLDKP